MAHDTIYRPTGMLTGRCIFDDGTSPTNRVGNAFDGVAQPSGARFYSKGEDLLSTSLNRAPFALANNVDFLNALGFRCTARPYLLELTGPNIPQTLDLLTLLPGIPVYTGPTSVSDCGMVLLDDEYHPILKAGSTNLNTITDLNNQSDNSIYVQANQIISTFTSIAISAATRYSVTIGADLTGVYAGSVITISGIDANFPPGTTSYDGTYVIEKIAAGVSSEVWLGPKLLNSTDRPGTYPAISNVATMRGVYEVANPFVDWDETYNATKLVGAGADVSTDGLFAPDLKVVLEELPDAAITTAYLLLGVADYATMPDMSGSLSVISKFSTRSDPIPLTLTKDISGFEPELADPADPALPVVTYHRFATPCIVQGNADYDVTQDLIALPAAPVRRDFSSITSITASLTDINASVPKPVFVESIGAPAYGVMQMGVAYRNDLSDFSAFDTTGLQYAGIGYGAVVQLGDVTVTQTSNQMTNDPGGADLTTFGLLPGDTIFVASAVPTIVVVLSVAAHTITMETAWAPGTETCAAAVSPSPDLGGSSAIAWKTMTYTGSDFTCTFNVNSGLYTTLATSDFVVAFRYRVIGTPTGSNALNLAVNSVLVEGIRVT
jgi:hypothetical protein